MEQDWRFSHRNSSKVLRDPWDPGKVKSTEVPYDFVWCLFLFGAYFCWAPTFVWRHLLFGTCFQHCALDNLPGYSPKHPQCIWNVDDSGANAASGHSSTSTDSYSPFPIPSIWNSGFWVLHSESCVLNSGSWILESRFLILVSGFWVLDYEFWILNWHSGIWMLVSGSRNLSSGSCILNPAF